MISIDEAQSRIFALKAPVETETVTLFNALGRFAAEDVVSLRTQPARDLSAMDGYALRAADSPGPWQVIGESAAGRRFDGIVGVGEAVRIFTGAVVPRGANSILMQENAVRNGDALTLTDEAPVAGKHIRRAGADFPVGALLIKAGEALTPARLALVAMGGHGAIRVARKVRVALISSGDELVLPGEPCAEDQIPSSNAVMLAAMLRTLPVEVRDMGIVRDDLTSLIAAIDDARDADIIVTSGGASVGEHDLIRPALKAAGGEIDFWKIAMRPGKPVIAGWIGNTAVLGLPGNPVSAFVTALLLLRPLIAHLSGSSNPLPQRIEARLGRPLPRNGNRADHIRAFLKDGVVTPAGQNDSSMLAALSASNALIIRDIGAQSAAIGDKTCCYSMD
jgi:molybdopterin molybdotransferase